MFDVGDLPIMVKSRVCNLRRADSRELVYLHEDPLEMGGYFILNGNERVVRLQILPKQNYPTSIVDQSFQRKGKAFSDKAVVIRCVRKDLSSSTVKLYGLSTGSARLGFRIRSKEFLIPVGIILKGLVEAIDIDIKNALASCYDEEVAKKNEFLFNNQLVREKANIILGELRPMSLYTRTECLTYMGRQFQRNFPDLETQAPADAAESILQDYIFVHLDDNWEKFNLLIFMLHKLFSLEDGNSMPDNPDCLQIQEVLLPGHLITIYLKDRLQHWLQSIRGQLQNSIDGTSSSKKNIDLTSDLASEKNRNELYASVKKVIDIYRPKIGLGVEHMLKTGNLHNRFTLELEQTAGMTIPVKRHNFLQFLSKFRAVHRGASYVGQSDSRTNKARKVLPESWGFICPLQTPPAGDQIGLLKHLTSSCRITSCYDSKGRIRDYPEARKLITGILVSCGMRQQGSHSHHIGLPRFLPVHLDGKVIGSVDIDQAEKVVACLRRRKLSETILEDLEVGYIPLRKKGAYPGLFMFTHPSRFVRPVRNLSVHHGEKNNIELIGPFEQVFMDIGCLGDLEGGTFRWFPPTHVEIDSNELYSVTASLIPYLNRNHMQSNTYQCQAAEQAMGFSLQSPRRRAGEDLYRLQTPQTPIVRTRSYEKYNMDYCPMGINAIVAVMSYTGYEMNGAVVLNKSSVERGMFHGSLYKTLTIDLKGRFDGARSIFRRRRRRDMDVSSENLIDSDGLPSADSDGLPYVGQRIERVGPYRDIYNQMTSNYLQETEPVIVVDSVAAISSTKNKLQKVTVGCRRSRNLEVGDKVSSRHGIMGVCSQLVPDVDMPFSEKTGMRPDILISACAIPSKKAMGMLVEALAAKGGTLHGKLVDGTPFATSLEEEKNDDELFYYIGEMLTEKGFQYNGTEVLYNGMYGEEMKCAIFMGPVYFQRHRQMDAVKAKVRSTGPVDPVTRQPTGRNTIRFGEMEKDALLAHGAAYLLHDRLHTSSDHHICDICTLCGSLLTITTRYKTPAIKGLPRRREVICMACNTGRGIETVAMPYVFRCLAAELAAMNIKLTIRLKDPFKDI